MKEDKKAVILETAERLFSELGFKGTSTRAIAAEAGVNMAMLNYYFGSKEGLYKAIFKHRLDNFHQLVLGLVEKDGSAWDKLYMYIDMFADRITSNSCFQRLMQNEIAIHNIDSTYDFILKYMERNTNELKKILRDGIKDKSFREVDVDMFFASLYGTKYYILNLSKISSVIFNKEITEPEVLQNEIKPRLKAHLKELSAAFLKPHTS